MKILELFAGSRSIGKVAKERGHKVCSVDIVDFDGIDIVKDIESLEIDDLPFIPDVVWSGTPCTTYSVAAISTHRDGVKPKTDFAAKCDRMNIHVNKLIQELSKLNPDLIYYIENPRGMLRKMPFMKQYDRVTVTYCSYGDFRMKPTDIWSNNFRSLFNPAGWTPRPICSAYKYDQDGNVLRKHCHHETSQRGGTVKRLKNRGIKVFKGGTEGSLNNNYSRSVMPPELCLEILMATENRLKHQ